MNECLQRIQRQRVLQMLIGDSRYTSRCGKRPSEDEINITAKLTIGSKVTVTASVVPATVVQTNRETNPDPDADDAIRCFLSLGLDMVVSGS